MFAALSENLDFFKSRLNLFVALAPVVRVDNCTSTLLSKMKDRDTLDKIAHKMEIHEILSSVGGNRKSAAFLHKLFPEINMLGIKLLSDDDSKEINIISLEAFMGHFPSGTSFKSIKHFKQLMKQQQFEHFDYGPEENRVRY